MEALLSIDSPFKPALEDKNFDPSTIEDLMKFFGIEAYRQWAGLELEHQKEIEESEIAMQEAENYLVSVMESAMEEFRRFEEDLDRMSKAELKSLVEKTEGARKLGNVMEKAATIASMKYIEAAKNSAMASSHKTKVHPSEGRF